MAKIIKNKLGNFLVICLIFLTVTVWVFSGWPQIWKKPAFPPEIQEAYALTATKTWVFDANAEGLVDAANSAFIDFAWVDAGEQAVNFYMDRKNVTHTEYARRATTGETWVSWGVPSGATVTHVQITAWQEKTVNNTDLASHTISARIVDSAEPAATVHSAGDLIAAVDPGIGIDADYQPGEVGDQVAVNTGSQSSATDVRLELEYTVTTAGSPNINQRFDTIELTITYTLPAELSITAPENVQMPDYTLGGVGYSEVNFGDYVRVTADAGFTVTVSSTNLTGGGNTILASDVKLRTDGNIENNPTRIPSASCSGFTPTEPAANEYALDTAKNVVTATLGAGGTCDIYPTIKVYISNNLLAVQVTGTLTFTVF